MPSPTLEYHLSDVFALERLTGNPLAVFLNPGDLPTADMQAIAKEIGYSETTFVMEPGPLEVTPSGKPSPYRVRIFTPASEIPFAGHPVLGTAEAIRRVWLKGGAGRVVLRTGAGDVPVDFAAEEGVAWMTHPQPRFFGSRAAADFATLLGLAPEDCDAAFPALEITTGFPTWIVPLTSPEALRRVRVDGAAFRKACAAHADPETAGAVVAAQNLLAFAPGGSNPAWALEARVFAECYGIPEDPATGSAAGCLAAYLVKTRRLGSDRVDLRYGQGLEMGRPSEIRLRAGCADGRYALTVGGRVVSVARGRWEIG